jgi:hypothetical protein
MRNRVNESQLQQDGGIVGLLLQDIFKGLPGLDVVSRNLMDIADLSVDIRQGQRLWRDVEDIFEALRVSDVR